MTKFVDHNAYIRNYRLNESLFMGGIDLIKADADEVEDWLDKKAMSPEGLNKILNGFKYGIVLHGEGKTQTGKDIDYSKYITSDIRTFLTYSTGTCWDYTNFEAWWFENKLGYKITNKPLKNGTFSTYYIMHRDKDGDMPSHTWLAYMKSGKVYLFESSWKDKVGIKEFDSEAEMIDYYEKAHREYHKTNNEVFICKYIPDNVEVDVETFMKKVMNGTRSRVIKNTLDDKVRKTCNLSEAASPKKDVWVSGNMTQYSEGAYFDKDINQWMRKEYPWERDGSIPVDESAVFEFYGLQDELNEANKNNPTNFNGYSSKKIAMANQDKNKYDGMFIADEKTWLKKIKFMSDPRIRGGKPQPCIIHKGKSYRPRAEVIVVHPNTGKVLIDPGRHRSFGYSLPGGGIDNPNEEIAGSARRECEEEARVIPSHVVYTGVCWIEKYANPMLNDGSLSFVCVAEYKKPYKGYVKVEDRDEFVDRCKWVDVDKLGEPHKMAIEKYMDMQLKEESIPDIDYSFLQMPLIENHLR